MRGMPSVAYGVCVERDVYVVCLWCHISCGVTCHVVSHVVRCHMSCGVTCRVVCMVCVVYIYKYCRDTTVIILILCGNLIGTTTQPPTGSPSLVMVGTLSTC